jgi:hypothetical protein
MTMHTYKVFLTHDKESEDPIRAAQAMHEYLLEMAQTMGVGDKRRPIYRVEQFVDTDKPPRVYFVDSLTWRAYADEGCTRLIDTDFFDGRVYNAMSPTAVMRSHIEVHDAGIVEALEALAAADDAELFIIDSSRMSYWADVAEFRDVLHEWRGRGVSDWATAALLSALAHVEERGAEEVHFHIQ